MTKQQAQDKIDALTIDVQTQEGVISSPLFTDTQKAKAKIKLGQIMQEIQDLLVTARIL